MTVFVIHFSGPINAQTTSMIQDLALNAIQNKASELHFHVSSEGGSTTYGFTLYNFLRSLPVKLVMHNMGSIESMANIFFLAADERSASPQSRFLIHPLHWDFTTAGIVDHGRLNERAACLANDLERYVSIFDERTKGADQPIDIRQCLSGTALILDPAAATTSGVIQSVTAKTLPEGATVYWARL